MPTCLWSPPSCHCETGQSTMINHRHSLLRLLLVTLSGGLTLHGAHAQSHPPRPRPLPRPRLPRPLPRRRPRQRPPFSRRLPPRLLRRCRNAPQLRRPRLPLTRAIGATARGSSAWRSRKRSDERTGDTRGCTGTTWASWSSRPARRSSSAGRSCCVRRSAWTRRRLTSGPRRMLVSTANEGTANIKPKRWTFTMHGHLRAPWSIGIGSSPVPAVQGDLPESGVDARTPFACVAHRRRREHELDVGGPSTQSGRFAVPLRGERRRLGNDNRVRRDLL